MRKLILLAGLHKTGTTSIQRTCVENLELLKAAGFLYPRFTTRRADGTIHHDENQSSLLSRMFRKTLPGAFAGDDFQQRADRFEAEKNALRSSLRKTLQASRSNVLLVAEECSRFTPEEMGDLRGYFSELGFEIDVFCSVRRPASWLVSMVAQAVAGRRSLRLTIAAMVQSYVSSGSLVVPPIRNLMQAFPQAKFHGFDAAVAHARGPVGFFLDAAQLDLGPTLRIVRANEGASDHAVRLNDRLNAALGHRYRSKQNDVFYGSLHSRYPALFEVPGPKFSLRAGEAVPLLPLLAEENNWLKQEFGEGFYDPHISFNADPVELDPATRQFLVDHFSSAEPPVKRAVDEYLASH